MSSPLGTPVGRIPVTKVSPVIEGGAYPSKTTLDERVPVCARVFREGHDAVGAYIDLVDPHGVHHHIPMAQQEPMGLDIWAGEVICDQIGLWQYAVVGYSDDWATWRHNAQLKLDAGVDLELVILEGRDLIEKTLPAAAEDAHALETLHLAHSLLDSARSILAVRETALQPSLDLVMRQYCPTSFDTPSPYYPLLCERVKARFSAWYEFFPRSWGATQADDGTWSSGTFATAIGGLDHAQAMGFDVVYLPPIHPIGHAFKKGPNNTLDASPSDPGSPWAIGNEAGGHDAINPVLGTMADFENFVTEAKQRDLEIAIDLVMNCSPDHPWVMSHPEWFYQRLDGTTAYAENPPKKYQDVYPLNFDNDPRGLAQAILDVVTFWIGKGVTIFRVDNPHTKPVSFWAWLIAEVRAQHPEVIWLAEAFTRPEMTQLLGKVGFTQSYTYFTWRNEKWELEQYLTELRDDWADFFRPNFFTNTPDINPIFTHGGQPAAFAIRAMLAATMSPSWGMYSGFEIFEHALFRSEEYLDSEKYELRPRDFSGDSMIAWVTDLNRLRREHPALQELRNIRFHHTTSDTVIAYSKVTGDDRLLLVCSLDPESPADAWVDLDPRELGLETDTVELTDVLSGESVRWNRSGWVGLNPVRVGQIFQVRGA